MAQKTIKVKLDGRQSYSFPVILKKNGRLLEEDVDIFVRGFLKFSSSTPETQADTVKSFEDRTVFYPVLFTFTQATVSNGRIVITLLPRSEDLLQTTNKLEIRAEVSEVTNQLISTGTLVAADEVLKDPEQEPVKIIIKTGEIRSPYNVSIEITVLDGVFSGQTIDTPAASNISGISLFEHVKLSQSSNLVIEFFGDDDWVPSIDASLGDNTGTALQALAKITELEGATPFGSSALYDAISESASILSDNDIDGLRKIIYVFTDNAANVSVKTLDEAVAEVNNIDGDGEVPILIGNLAIVTPITLSVKANISDTRNINKLGFLTGGQSVTLVTESDVDDIVTIFYRSAVGALGKGTFEFTVDLGEEVSLSNIRSIFSLPDDRADASWTISTSLDNLQFTDIDDSYGPNILVDFDNILVRYIRFTITLVTGFSSIVDVYLVSATSPILEEIQITFNKSETVFLFLNVQENDNAPTQMAVAVDANNNVIDMNQIQVGLAKSDAVGWEDFFTGGQPFVDQNGKIVVSLRVSNDTSEFQREPLSKIDRFTLQTSYGSWDPTSSVVLYDKDDAVIPETSYQYYSNDGLVVMSSILPHNYQLGDFKINITNTNKSKIGLRLTNKSFSDTLDVFGIGKMFSTNKNLNAPLAKVPPEVRNVVISIDRLTIYSKIGVSYEFFDTNFDKEDTGKTIIKWFINDVHVAYLDDLREWNDVGNANDPLFTRAFTFNISDLKEGETVIEKAQENNESILNVGDKIHFTVQVSDGDLLSDLVNSNVLSVFQDKPVAKDVVVKGLLPGGAIIDRISADNSAIVQFNFQSDIDENETEIVWFVDADEFKRGKIGEGDSPDDGSCPITKICPAEVGTANLQVGLIMLNEIFVQVTPISRGIIGDTITSETVVVRNALPTVSDVVLTPNSPNAQEDLFLRWNFFDFEIDALDLPSQEDTSRIQWFRKASSTAEFKEVVDAASLSQIIVNIPGRNSIVNNSLTAIGQEWFAKVTPNDSLDDGETVDSNIVTIFSGGN